MRNFLPILLVLVTLAFACGDDDCPPGQVLIGAACVAALMDAGPPADEVCNGMDDDGDGEIDEADPELGAACGDDVGACTVGVQVCVDGALMCDGVMPGDEVCNSMDDDCDGEVDENVQTTFYLDEDLDTFGGDTTCDACAVAECGDGSWVAVSGDCDDTCETCFEGGVEVCDTFDNDCDDDIDEEVQTTVYPDEDLDGFGVGEGALVCEVSVGFAEVGGDCADEDARAFPGATEYYSTPIMGETAGPAYDFDCSGEEDKQHNACGSSSCLNGFCYNSIHDDCGDENLLRETEVLLGRCTIPDGSPSTNGPVRCR